MLFIKIPCLAAWDEALEARANVAFTGGDLEVSVYNTRIV